MARRAVFLDRDGVLNDRRFPFLLRPSQLRIASGAPAAVARLTAAGYLVVVATNQPALALGLTRRSDVDAIHDEIRREVERAGGRIDRVEVSAAGPFSRDPSRKPRPGMLLAAAQALDVDLATSWMVGDQERDVLAGRAAGCRTILCNPPRRVARGRASELADAVVPDLSRAVDRILGKPRSG